MNSSNVDTKQTGRRRWTRIIVTAALVLLTCPVVFVTVLFFVPGIARHIEFRLATFDRDRWQSCAGDMDVIRSPRRTMAVAAVRQHLRAGTPREHVFDTLGKPESRGPGDKTFSYWLGYPRLFYGLDGDWLHVYFDDNGRVVRSEIVD